MIEQNWPSQMADNLGVDLDRVYAMAVGGWGAVQYLDMFYNATLFQPRVTIPAMIRWTHLIWLILTIVGVP